MNEDKLKTWILRRFGAPVVKVELDQCHLDDAVSNAKRWFAAKKGVKKQKFTQIIANVTEYNLTLIEQDIDKILDVIFPMPGFDVWNVFSPFAVIGESVPYAAFAAPSSGGLYSSYTQAMQHVEMAKRILGAEQQWFQDDRMLRITPRPSQSGTMMIEYSSSKFSVEQLSERDHDLLKRYALTKAKEDLGRIRSKYGTYPTAQGEVSLDGERLLDEAKEEIEALNEEIGQSAMPMYFLTG